MKDGTVSEVNMQLVHLRAKVNAEQKPSFNISLSHLAPGRNKTDNGNSKAEIAKLQVMHSFTQLRQVLLDEIDKATQKASKQASPTRTTQPSALSLRHPSRKFSKQI